jgi:hypothetical protein
VVAVDVAGPVVVDPPAGTEVGRAAVVVVTRGRVPLDVVGVAPRPFVTVPAESSVNRLLRQSPPPPVGASPRATAVSSTSREMPAGLGW